MCGIGAVRFYEVVAASTLRHRAPASLRGVRDALLALRGAGRLGLRKFYELVPHGRDSLELLWRVGLVWVSGGSVGLTEEGAELAEALSGGGGEAAAALVARWPPFRVVLKLLARAGAAGPGSLRARLADAYRAYSGLLRKLGLRGAGLSPPSPAGLARLLGPLKEAGAVLETAGRRLAASPAAAREAESGELVLRVRAREPLMAAALADVLYHGRRAYVYTPFLGRSAAALIAKVLEEAGGGSVTLFASRVGPGGALEPLRGLSGVTVCAPAGGAWAGSFAYSEGGHAAYLPVPLSASLYSKGGGFVVVWPRAPSWLASFLSELSC